MPDVQRGAVLRSGRAVWLVWQAGMCLPIRAQAVPRSRWDYRLASGDAPGLGGQAMMVCGAQGRAVQTDGMAVVTTLVPGALAALATQLRRAAESEALEARYRM